jgi:hypothetical protein
LVYPIQVHPLEGLVIEWGWNWPRQETREGGEKLYTWEGDAVFMEGEGIGKGQRNRTAYILFPGQTSHSNCLM